jgi:hypothetical protein
MRKAPKLSPQNSAPQLPKVSAASKVQGPIKKKTPKQGQPWWWGEAQQGGAGAQGCHSREDAFPRRRRWGEGLSLQHCQPITSSSRLADASRERFMLDETGPGELSTMMILLISRIHESAANFIKSCCQQASCQQRRYKGSRGGSRENRNRGSSPLARRHGADQANGEDVLGPWCAEAAQPHV